MYNNTIKTEWRHAVWKSLAGLVPNSVDPKKEGYILALAGKRFLDRKVAKQHGFPEDRIIGVDTDPEVAEHNKKHGRIVIERELSEVMRAWSDDRPVSVLIADFTGNGGTKYVQETIWNWAHLKAFEKCWLVLNVSVGRETRYFLKYIREGLCDEEELKDYNRARAAIEFCLCEDIGWPDEFLADPGLELANAMIAGDARYQAHRMNMDSCIVAPMWNERWNEEERVSGVDLVADSTIRRHIGAKFAWQTMYKEKKNG